jgi:hypothetical protein
MSDVRLSARILAAITACLAWAGLGIQLHQSIEMSLARGQSVAQGFWMYIAFFTISTNFLVAVATTSVAAFPSSRVGRWFGHPNTITGIAPSIVIVSATYHAILAGMHPLRGIGVLANSLMHDAVPLLFLAFWAVAVPRYSIAWRRAALWALYPIAYFGYAMLRGVSTGFYPYWFINVTQLGIVQVLVNAIGVLLIYFVLLAVLIAGKFSFRAAASPETAA